MTSRTRSRPQRRRRSRLVWPDLLRLLLVGGLFAALFLFPEQAGDLLVWTGDLLAGQVAGSLQQAVESPAPAPAR